MVENPVGMIDNSPVIYRWGSQYSLSTVPAIPTRRGAAGWNSGDGIGAVSPPHQ